MPDCMAQTRFLFGKLGVAQLLKKSLLVYEKQKLIFTFTRAQTGSYLVSI